MDSKVKAVLIVLFEEYNQSGKNLTFAAWLEAEAKAAWQQYYAENPRQIRNLSDTFKGILP